MLHSAPPVQLELFPYASPESVAGLGAIHRRYPGRQPSAQCLRMLTALAAWGSVSLHERNLSWCHLPVDHGDDKRAAT
jgi:hypothetical protein